MYGYNPTQADTRAAMQTLRDRGVAKVVIHFSGGNDEGGADGADFLDADGNKVEGIDNSAHVYENETWDSVNRRFVSQGWTVSAYNRAEGRYENREATADEIAVAKLMTILEAPIYDRYGSFAGEFYCHGTVEWDVASGTNEMHGQESHEEWDSF